MKRNSVFRVACVRFQETLWVTNTFQPKSVNYLRLEFNLRKHTHTHTETHTHTVSPEGERAAGIANSLCVQKSWRRRILKTFRRFRAKRSVCWRGGGRENSSAEVQSGQKRCVERVARSQCMLVNSASAHTHTHTHTHTHRHTHTDTHTALRISLYLSCHQVAINTLVGWCVCVCVCVALTHIRIPASFYSEYIVDYLVLLRICCTVNIAVIKLTLNIERWKRKFFVVKSWTRSNTEWALFQKEVKGSRCGPLCMSGSLKPRGVLKNKMCACVWF